ncbi:Neutral/alkaline non-lysosomal ceramidase-domain-containing protein [Mycena olivaceomarginata]|nr:Neutral/alkaline non-lysosomal ceramidase-domain-containing protein [Mycena olivaceomarginata]
MQIRKHWEAKRSLRAGRTRGKRKDAPLGWRASSRGNGAAQGQPLRARAIRVNASGEHTRTANVHHASRTHIRGEAERRHARMHTGRERKSGQGCAAARDGALARGYVGVRHTRHADAMAYHAYSDSCTCRCRVSAAGRGGKNQADTPSGGPRILYDTAVAGADVRGWCLGAHVHRASCIPCHDTKLTTHAVRRVRGQAGMRAPADDDASCEVLYGGADADADAEAGSLALRLVRGRRRANAQAGTSHRRAAHTTAARREAQGRGDAGFEAAHESTLRGEAQAGQAAHAIRAHTARHPPSRLRLPWLPLPSSLHSPILPYFHHAPHRSPTLASSPSIAPPAPASVRRSARKSWGVGARPSWVWVRPSEPRSWVWVRSRSWVQEARYPPLELELAGANQDANGEDAPVQADGALSSGGGGRPRWRRQKWGHQRMRAARGWGDVPTAGGADDVNVRRRGRRGGFPVRKGFNDGRHRRSKCQSRRRCGRGNRSARYRRASERVHDGRACKHTLHERESLHSTVHRDSMKGPYLDERYKDLIKPHLASRCGLLVQVWGDGERIKFFKLIKRGKRGEKRGKIRDLFMTIFEGVSRCGRRECERTTTAHERYQDDAEARRVISRSNPSGYSAWFGLNPIIFKMGGPFFAPLRASEEQERERELKSWKLPQFYRFLTRHVNQQGSSPSLQDELHAGVAVPDREGDVQYLRPAQTPSCAGEQGPGWGRAVGETGAASATTRIVYVNADITMGDTGVRRAILAQLATKYGGLYTVSGYLENLLPQLPALGFVKQTYNTIVTGIVLAIDRAYSSLVPGTLSLGNATVTGGNINRSLRTLANPAAEHALYDNPCDRGDQDKVMSLLSFGNCGFLSWFPVHGTSIYENNTLVSSDNKGMVAYLYEASVKPNAMPGNQTFVVGFAQANVGDTSPNMCIPPSPRSSIANTHLASAPSVNPPGNRQHLHLQRHRQRPAMAAGPPSHNPYGFHSNEVIAQVQVDAAKGLVNGSKLGGGELHVRAPERDGGEDLPGRDGLLVCGWNDVRIGFPTTASVKLRI